MRSDDRTDDVVSGFDGGHPVAHGFVERVFQGLAAGFDRHDLGDGLVDLLARQLQMRARLGVGDDDAVVAESLGVRGDARQTEVRTVVERGRESA